MKFEGDVSAMIGLEPQTNSGSRAPALTSVEKGFSCQAAAAKCDELSSQLARMAEMLRHAPSDSQGELSERAMVESVIRGRRLRDAFFDPMLFADPAWDILLDLYLAKLEHRQTNVSNLCGAAAVPTTTALRHIQSLVERGLVVRKPSRFDQRVVHVELTGAAVVHMQAYFQRLTGMLTGAPTR